MGARGPRPKRPLYHREARDPIRSPLARTDCRPTQGIDEAVARIEMYVEEGADILLLDSPADEEEIRRAVAAAAGRPSFAVLSPGAPRATPSASEAAVLGFKIGTFPTSLLSPAAAGMKAGLGAPCP